MLGGACNNTDRHCTGVVMYVVPANSNNMSFYDRLDPRVIYVLVCCALCECLGDVIQGPKLNFISLSSNIVTGLADRCQMLRAEL